MRKNSAGENPMLPYDFVSRQDYETQRHQRLLLDALPQDEEIVMRYAGRDKKPNFYAADYIVCVRGISRARKISEVHFEPIRLDGPAARRAIGHTKIDNDGFLVSARQVIFSTIAAERGYFLGAPQELKLTPEDIINQANPIDGPIPGTELQIALGR
jgi:hypothetical protein